MQPTREIVIRQYMPGSYECECDGRTTSCHTRAELGLYLRNWLGWIPDPQAEEEIAVLEQKIEDLQYTREVETDELGSPYAPATD